MSIMVSLSQSLALVENGVTVVDIENAIADYEVDNHLDIHLRLAPAGTLELDIATTTMIADWAAIVGLVGVINAPAYGELVFAATALEPIQVGPGPICLLRAETPYLMLTNTSAVAMSGKLYVFGRV